MNAHDQALLTHTMDALHAEGVRMTAQRRAILAFLVETETHPTAEEIYETIRPNVPNLSPATVYNTVNLLVDHGLLQKIKTEDGAVHFDFFVEPHAHLICEDCGQIVDFHYGPLLDLIRAAEAESGFEINDYRVELHGLCPNCQMKRRVSHD